MVIDANVWISQHLANDVNHSVAARWFELAQRSTPRFAVPISCLAEVAGAIARRMSNPTEGLRLARLVSALPNLETLEIDDALGREGMRLAANLRLRGADALYVAVAARLDMPLVTFDGELASRASTAVAVITPN